MINFFRKIRQSLFTENKFGKYLIYAVGEIILVVIGILIAISINNWKESLELKTIERQVYNDVLQELRTDLVEIQDKHRDNQNHLSRFHYGSEIILNDSQMKLADTLGLIAMELTQFSDFNKNTTAYDALAASGKLELITNKNILRQLQQLGNHYNYINRLEKNNEQVVFMTIPKLFDYIRMNPFKVIKPEELYSYQFHNTIEAFIHIGEEKDVLYEQAKKNLDRLITSLEKELG
jgi:hypothetical protein